MTSGELQHLQFPLLIADAVAAQLVARGSLEIEVVAGGLRSLVVGIAQVQAEHLDGLLVGVADADIGRCRERHAVGGPQRLAADVLGIRRRANFASSVPPLVLVIGERQRTDLPVARIAERPGVTGRPFEREIWIQRRLLQFEVAVETGCQLDRIIYH